MPIALISVYFKKFSEVVSIHILFKVGLKVSQEYLDGVANGSKYIP